jgi:hypothetical protein
MLQNLMFLVMGLNTSLLVTYAAPALARPVQNARQTAPPRSTEVPVGAA